jgi:hypothetical protein
MGASGAVCAKLSAASDEVAFVASSDCHLLWKEGASHCCCLERNAGVYVVIERGFKKSDFDGVDEIARLAVRRRRYLRMNCELAWTHQPIIDELT